MSAAVAHHEAWNWEAAIKFGEPSDQLGPAPDLAVLEVPFIHTPTRGMKRKLSSFKEPIGSRCVNDDDGGTSLPSPTALPLHKMWKIDSRGKELSDKDAPLKKRPRLRPNNAPQQMQSKMVGQADSVTRGASKKIESANEKPKKQEVIQAKVHTMWPAARVQIYRDNPDFQALDIPTKAKDRGFHHEFDSNSTPSPVDPRLIDSDISIEEILTYFPQHTTYHEVNWRIMKHWAPSEVVKYIFWTRDFEDKKLYSRDGLHHRKIEAEIWARIRERTKTVNGTKVNVATPDSKHSPVKDPLVKRNFSQVSYSSGRRGADLVNPFDYPIYSLADGVHQGRHPTGKGAQLLTHVIKHILDVSHDWTVMLSDIRRYAEKWNITVPDGNRPQGDIEVEDAAAVKRYGKHGTIVNIHEFYSSRFGRMK